MKTLELFSGTESFSKVARGRGHETFTIELDKSFNPDWCVDVMEITSQNIIERFGNPDFIWASPPCQSFSVASIGKHWNKDRTPKTEQAKKSMELVNHTWKLIQELNPKYFIIENPRGMLRKLNIIPIEFMKTVTYCQYGDNRMKPTDLWTNINFNPKKCKNGMSCHVSAPRGSRTGTQGLKGSKLRSVVPEELCIRILEADEE